MLEIFFMAPFPLSPNTSQVQLEICSVSMSCEDMWLLHMEEVLAVLSGLCSETPGDSTEIPQVGLLDLDFLNPHQRRVRLFISCQGGL